MKNRMRQGNAATRAPGIMAVMVFLLATPGEAENLPGKPAEKPTDIAERVEFDNIFLNLENKNAVDLSRFANGATALPGRYRALIYINGQATLTSEIDVVAQPDKTSRVCLTPDLIKTIPFNYEKVPKDFLATFQQGQPCLDLEKKLPHSEVVFDTSEQRLDISVPQIYLLHNARGSVNPELWDSGIPALMLGYNMNGYSSHANGETLNSFYSSLEGGLNVGAGIFAIMATTAIWKRASGNTTASAPICNVIFRRLKDVRWLERPIRRASVRYAAIQRRSGRER